MYRLREVTDKVWVAEFTSDYNLAMTFLRYQEYYESPNPKFFRNPFAINEYVDWYSKGKKFEYHLDWTGFNIPSKFIFECQNNIPDHNDWDKIMSDIITEIKTSSGDVFYLLGVKKGDNKVLEHEIAHGLFFTNKEYQDEMTELYNSLPPPLTKKIHKYLSSTGGYSKEVFMDETQAYMATGIPMKLKIQSFSLFNEYSKKFKDIFIKYYNPMKEYTIIEAKKYSNRDWKVGDTGNDGVNDFVIV